MARINLFFRRIPTKLNTKAVSQLRFLSYAPRHDENHRSNQDDAEFPFHENSGPSKAWRSWTSDPGTTGMAFVLLCLPIAIMSFAAWTIGKNLGKDMKLYPSDRHHFMRGKSPEELKESEDPDYDYSTFIDDSQSG